MTWAETLFTSLLVLTFIIWIVHTEERLRQLEQARKDIAGCVEGLLRIAEKHTASINDHSAALNHHTETIMTLLPMQQYREAKK